MKQNIPKSSTVLQRFRNHWISAVLFLIPLAIYLLGVLFLHVPELYEHVLLTISAVMGIHVLDRLYLVKDTEDALDTLVQDIRTDISHQTQTVQNTSNSLQALDACGISRIFPTRVDAAEDIRADVSDPGNSKIYLMGISLNDFIQGMDHTLLGAWAAIQEFIQGQRRINEEKGHLDIRILIIDPLCFGAALRAEAESASSSAIASRLKNDVEAAAKALFALEEANTGSSSNVTFACKLYRLPPTMFLCWVDSVCYVQQYHFWSARDNRTPIPVLKYRNLPASVTTYPYHDEMKHHFEWIWKHAAIPVSQYLEGSEIGIDAGMQGCAAINVFTDADEASERIVYLLKGAKEKVSIQGISLHSFFKAGSLRAAISDVLREQRAQIEVLLLNPESDQAKFRSYRERLLISPEQEFEDFIKRGEHESSDLYHDTKRTIENIEEIVSALQENEPNSWSPHLTVGLYDTAPACFVLRIDDRVLVEQYHYGKVAQETRAILGKDMPLVEYVREPTEIIKKVFQQESDPLRRPFDLLVDHVDFALEQAEKLRLPTMPDR